MFCAKCHIFKDDDKQWAKHTLWTPDSIGFIFWWFKIENGGREGERDGEKKEERGEGGKKGRLKGRQSIRQWEAT